jgi:hypothetical protein
MIFGGGHRFMDMFCILNLMYFVRLIFFRPAVIKPLKETIPVEFNWLLSGGMIILAKTCEYVVVVVVMLLLSLCGSFNSLQSLEILFLNVC